MSLDTILKIGHVLRSSENNLKHFKYVETCPKDNNGKYPICITIPVKEDFSFDWGNIILTPEKEYENLYYLKFKTSNADTSASKYFFGDIFYSRKSDLDKNGKPKSLKEFGNYTLKRGSAFDNGQNIYTEIREMCYNKYAYSLLEHIQDEKQKQKKAKELILRYKKQTEKEVATIQDKQDNLFDKFRKLVDNNNLISFNSVFKHNLDIIELILMYAPAFENIIKENPPEIFKYLNDTIKLKEKYIQIAYQSLTDSVKKQLLGKQDKGLKSDDILCCLNDTTKQQILKYANFSVFIHFRFGNNRHWHDIKDAFELLKNNLNSKITRMTEFGLVPDAYIYRTLCSGNSKNDIQFPDFDKNKAYKSFVFKSEKEFEAFLYTDKILNKQFHRLHKTEIDLFVFPIAIQGKDIKAYQYDTFFEKTNEDLLQSNEDSLLFLTQNEEPTNFSKFDFILSDSSGNTTNDLIEISGIEQSNLKSISEQIRSIASKIRKEREDAILYDKKLTIEHSLLNILGTYQTNKNDHLEVIENHRYKSHILKVLPLIYMRNYYYDLVLLPAFIKNIEKIIRMINDKFSSFKYEQLKYDLKFLLLIQNSENNRYMEITNSKSYQIGLGLGKLSKPLKKKINSFEKRYVGLLTRRVSTKEECISFCNEINEMLVRHEKVYVQLVIETISKLIEIPIVEYNKEEFSLGFFEGYFKYEANDDKKQFLSKIEKIISDYEEKETFQEEIKILYSALENLKTTKMKYNE